MTPALAALLVAALIAALVACSTPASAPSGAPAAPSAAPLVVPPAGSAPATPAPAHAFRYELVLTGTEGTTTTRSSFALDVSDEAPSSIRFGKNVRIGNTNNRSDVGMTLKSRLTYESGTPRLDVEANVGWIDAAGKGHHYKTEGGARTPPGDTATIFDATQEGRQLRLTATPKPLPSMGTAGEGPVKDAYIAEVALSHSEGITTAKASTLSLSLTGGAVAVAKTVDTIPLSVSDAGVMPRIDIGTRVKASAHPHGTGVVLDLDLEVSGVEPNAETRKITLHGPFFAPLDSATTAFSAEEDGHRYVVTITLRRAP